MFEHRKFNVLNVLPHMPKAAGTSVFCGEVSNVLSWRGYGICIGTFDANNRDRLYEVEATVEIKSIEDVMASIEKFSIVHIHGIWDFVLHKVMVGAVARGIPIVWSPHGMLTTWALHNKWLKKQIGWWLYQKRDLAKADLIHVTAQSEVEDVRRLGLTNELVIAPLGVRAADNVVGPICHNQCKTLLFVSRVQKKKGLANLVRAWAELKPRNWKVRIVGPDEDGHAAEIMELCRSCGVADGFEFVGPRYGKELAMEYASADLFVLPTHSENFGSVVIEALACGVPVICTKGAPWGELESCKCGWWIDIGVEPLAHALRNAMSLDSATLHEMGERGRRLVEEKYTWSSVADIIEAAYTQLIDRHNRSGQ